MNDSSGASGGRDAGPAGRRLAESLRAAITGLPGRLVPRSFRSDRKFDPRSESPMSDAELREAFRAASLSVTPAPLRRPARRDAAPAGSDASASLPSPDATSTVDVAAVALAVLTVAPAGPETAATASGPPADRPASPALAGSACPGGPTIPPETPASDSSVIPGNVTSTADDFFGGVVRRVDTRR